MKKASIELFIIALILIASFFLFSNFDMLEKIVEFSARYENYEIDEALSTLIILAICLSVFTFRRWREAINSLNIIKLKNEEINKAKAELKKLEGIIPICMHCKEIRDDSGAWHQLEKYISENSEAVFSHGICEKCSEKHYPNFNKEKN